MGWSCRVDAANTERAWDEACRASTGSSNMWVDGDKKFFYEASRTEHRDGAITGVIWKFVDETHVVKVGTFRINGDGTIARAPAFLKKAAAAVKRPAKVWVPV